MPSEFKNEPLTDFSTASESAAFKQALEEVRASFGQTAPLWIDGREVTASETFT